MEQMGPPTLEQMGPPTLVEQMGPPTFGADGEQMGPPTFWEGLWEKLVSVHFS